MKKDNFCVIMAGGVGSRFWPLSTSDKPKQFLDILGVGKTLLQLTFERFISLCDVENFYIVTNKVYKETVLEQLPLLKENQVLLEPMRRNTAPCIQYANYVIRRRTNKANIIVAPSDHIILKETEFIDVISRGLDFVGSSDRLLTLGIMPNRPDTGYGYIQAVNDESNSINKVKTFTEKPDLETAKFFLDSGEFFWNSGIFLWSLDSIDKAFKQYLPDVFDLFNSKHDGVSEQDFINRIYSECVNISIDYGIMEKALNVYVYKSDFGWSDLGTWGSLYENTPKDSHSNSLISGKIMHYDTENTIGFIPSDKLAVIQGLNDFIVIDSGKALLICKRSEEQRIRQFVNNIENKFGKTFI